MITSFLMGEEIMLGGFGDDLFLHDIEPQHMPTTDYNGYQLMEQLDNNQRFDGYGGYNQLEQGETSSQDQQYGASPGQNAGNNQRKNYPKTKMTIHNLDQLCQNYMRGGCDYHGCKFYHPTPTELIVYSKTIQKYYLQRYGQIEICRDFLNNKCLRENCRYKHPDEYWLDVYEKFNNENDECGIYEKQVQSLKKQIQKPILRLTDTPQPQQYQQRE